MLSFKMALRSIGSNKMRAILTMLGIIIGVMALVVLVSLVNGATSSVTDTISSLGSNLLTVTVSDDKGSPITMDTLKQWSESEPNLGLVAPYASDTITGSANGESGSFTVYGTTVDYYDIQGLQLSMGRWLKQSDMENNTYACVINERKHSAGRTGAGAVDAAPLVAAPFERTCERCEQVAPDGIGIVVVLPHLGSLPPQQAL